jgi:ribosome-binding protein aMBF1 (putative translation factor)
MATRKSTAVKTTAPRGKAAAARKPAPKKAPASRVRKDAATLPNRARHLREAADLSPKDLALRLGKDWTASTVRRIERGARKATMEQIAQLADALAVPVADLGFTTATVDDSAVATPRLAGKPRKVV